MGKVLEILSLICVISDSSSKFDFFIKKNFSLRVWIVHFPGLHGLSFPSLWKLPNCATKTLFSNSADTFISTVLESITLVNMAWAPQTPGVYNHSQFRNSSSFCNLKLLWVNAIVPKRKSSCSIGTFIVAVIELLACVLEMAVGISSIR